MTVATPARGRAGRADLLIALATQALAPRWFPLASSDVGFVRGAAVTSEPSGLTAPQGGVSAAREADPPAGGAERLCLPSMWVLEASREIEGAAEPDLPDTLPEDVHGDSAAESVLPDRTQLRRVVQAWMTAGFKQRWPLLRTRLRKLWGEDARLATIDWPRLVDQLASGEHLQRLPSRRWPRWPGGLSLVLDRSAAVQPFHDEWDALRRRLARHLGPALQTCRVRRQAGRLYWHTRPRMGGQVLLLTDLAQADREHADAWSDWLRAQQRGGSRLWWLAPQAQAGLPSGCQRPMLLPWSVHCRDSDRVETLLALLAGFGACSDVLLRALAPLVAPEFEALDLAWRVWNHPSVNLHSPYFRVTGPEWLERFGKLPLRLRQQALERAALLLAGRGPQAFHQLMLRLHAIAPDLVPALTQAQCYLRHLGSRIQAADLPERRRLEQAAFEILAATPSRTRLQLRPELRRLQRLASVERLRLGEAITRYSELGAVTLSAGAGARVPRTLRQVGQTLRLGPADVLQGRGLPLASLMLAEDDVCQLGMSGVCVPATAEGAVLGTLPATEPRIELLAGSRIWTLARIDRPHWAAGFGRDERGAYVLAGPLGSYQHRFEIPEGKGRNPDSPLIWQGFDTLSTSHGLGPGWGIGVDRHGCFASLIVDGVEQRFRWIPPGRFWMGSPETEHSRFADEGPQHEVTLSEGFWLADTACSQAFWLAVVGGENPSSFGHDQERPVERVSWHDVMQRFVPALREALAPGMTADLPTEAEWEYACRAGTDTPFHHGETLSADQANFNTASADAVSAGGRFSGATVPVRSFEPNDWGLHQMHGNVWEWCRDGQRDYGSAAVTDPEGAPEANGRVLRGGSWYNHAGYARSAVRLADQPGYRFHDGGFRLVLRSITSTVRDSGPEGRAASTGGEAPAVPSQDAERPATLMKRMHNVVVRKP